MLVHLSDSTVGARDADVTVLERFIDGLDGRFGPDSCYSAGKILSERVRKQLKVLLSNAFVDFKGQVERGERGALPFFTLDQLLWLTREGWLCSFMRQVVAVQPVGSHSSLLYFVRNGDGGVIPRERLERAMEEAGVDKADFNIDLAAVGVCSLDSVGVVPQVYKYNCCFYSGVDFDVVKGGYARALGAEIDSFILGRMPNVNFDLLWDGLGCAALIYRITRTGSDMRDDVLRELGRMYDYIVGPQRLIDVLKTGLGGSLCGCDLYVIDEVLDSNYYGPLVVAGKRSDSILRKPIFAPFILLSTFRSGLPCSVINFGMMRAGWCG